ncbi:AfsA-related hotdog domain-containing protein [Rhodococcus sp. NPDC058505]|uniref:AfsA-related hotdog domain-containing protein n=1 Tax=Rhodococcus sp. NPDC058505 TaxID=3346531 RepID=UPI00365349A2
MLRTDLTHPVLFDHPSDHVPGAVLLEAARQSARLVLGTPCADVESIDLEFQQFVELDEPTTVTATPAVGGEDAVTVDFAQWGVTKARGTVRLEPLRAAACRHAVAEAHRA